MSSRAWRTRTFNRSCVSVSWSAIRRSISACMSIGLPLWIASSTSRRSWRATWGSSPLAAFARTICNEFSMTARKWASRAVSAASRASILALDRSSQLNERLLEPGDVGAEVLQVVPIHLEAGERVADRLDEGRLADGIVGVRGEALDLPEILRRHRDLGLVQEDLRPGHVGPFPLLPTRLPSDFPEGGLRGRDHPTLAQAVPRPLSEEGDVPEDAS